MNQEEQREALQEAFFEVLEQMAYTFGDPAEFEDLQQAAGELWCAAMSFEGPFQGAIELAVPAAVCGMLAENMLGVDPDDERAQDKARDALKEVLNVTCGSVLTKIAGDEPVFTLSVPEVSILAEEDWRAMASAPEIVAVLVEDEPALLRVCIEGGTAG